MSGEKSIHMLTCEGFVLGKKKNIILPFNLRNIIMFESLYKIEIDMILMRWGGDYPP